MKAYYTDKHGDIIIVDCCVPDDAIETFIETFKARMNVDRVLVSLP